MASRPVTISALGIAQILGWGTSFYFPAVLAPLIVADTGWPLGWVVSGTSIGLLVAGLMAPGVGVLIDRHGGRPVLAASSVLFSLGLAGVGVAPNLPAFLLAWVVLGAGMGTGLYDAAFAALGKLYGNDARAPITDLTLFGGFSGTVCWPLSALLAETFGWRGACLIYAGLHVAVSLPLQMAVVPPLTHGPPATAHPGRSAPKGLRTPPLTPEGLVLVLLALVLSISSGIGAIVIVHMMIFLQARGADLALAVMLGALFGPAQVGARVMERVFGARYHPIWTMVASCVLMLAGLILMLRSFSVLVLAIVLYGGGYGIMWIARGTLPLALFGPDRYPVLLGRIAFPSLIAQALSPSAGAFLIEARGADATLAALSAFAALNIVLVGILTAICGRRSLRGRGTGR
jgi:predicted MFS family arabinose efflux permease